MTVTNHYASAAERTQVLDFDHGEGLNFLSLKDRRRLLEALEKATPEIPQASFPVEVQTGGGYQPHRLAAAQLRRLDGGCPAAAAGRV